MRVEEGDLDGFIEAADIPRGALEPYEIPDRRRWWRPKEELLQQKGDNAFSGTAEALLFLVVSAITALAFPGILTLGLVNPQIDERIVFLFALPVIAAVWLFKVLPRGRKTTSLSHAYRDALIAVRGNPAGATWLARLMIGIPSLSIAVAFAAALSGS